MTINLFKEIAEKGYHSSIITTYSVDPAFYDRSIQYRLRSYGCENNILLADSAMLKQALLAAPEGFAGAGSRYAVVPVNVRGCFHPKINLRLGTDSATLIIGSANATAAGWGGNQEVVTSFTWNNKQDDPITSAAGIFIRKAYDYLDSWLSVSAGGSLTYKRELHKRYSPWLQDIAPVTAPVELPDGSAIDVFFENGNDEQSMMFRLFRLIGNHAPQRLIIISPYWDLKLQALKEMQNLLGNCPVIIGLHPDRNEFPVDALDASGDIRFVSLKNADNEYRFLHAKIILVETAEFDHVLFGSANCSDDALGGMKIRARNAETSVYRRLPRGKVREALQLDLSNILDKASIRPQKAQSRLYDPAKQSLPAGPVEMHGDLLVWFPAPNLDGKGAQILIGMERITLKPWLDGRFCATLPSRPDFPCVVRIALKDGRETDPVIVHDVTALRHAAPGAVDRRLQKAFSRIMDGEEDIIDLAQQAHILFAPDSNLKNGSSGRAGYSRDHSEGQDYATPEDFRQALALKPATGGSHRFSVGDPSLIELLRIILKGIVDVGGKDADERREEEEAADLRIGENEDGDEYSEKEGPAQNEGRSSVPSIPKSDIYTPEQIKYRRKYLLKALKIFDDLVGAASEQTVSNRLLIQTAFAINLMLYACRKDHKMKGDKVVRLMDFAPGGSNDRELTFAIRAGRLLQRIWVGVGKNPSIISRMKIDLYSGPMPDDVFALIIMSRWAIIRAFLAVSETKNMALLQKTLSDTAIRLYQATSSLGLIDRIREEEIIRQLDKSIGYSEEESYALIQSIRSFIR